MKPRPGGHSISRARPPQRLVLGPRPDAALDLELPDWGPAAPRLVGPRLTGPPPLPLTWKELLGVCPCVSGLPSPLPPDLRARVLGWGTGEALVKDITLRASGGGHSGEVISENLQEVGRGSPVPGVPAPGVFGPRPEIPWDPEFRAEL